jgi:RHS repeat-associated protein
MATCATTTRAKKSQVVTQDPWGNLLPSSYDSVPGGMPYRFVGGLGVRWDAGTGLHYMRQRWYDPGLGRFVSRDPIPQTNPYTYVTNLPNTLTDSYGLQSDPAPWKSTLHREDLYKQLFSTIVANRWNLAAGRSTNLQAVCSIMHAASDLAGDNTADFMALIYAAFMPNIRNPSRKRSLPESQLQVPPLGNPAFANPTGWDPLLLDSFHPEEDQAHHLVAYMEYSYMTSETRGAVADFFQKFPLKGALIRNGDPNLWNMGDLRLGMVGVKFGARMKGIKCQADRGRLLNRLCATLRVSPFLPAEGEKVPAPRR